MYKAKFATIVAMLVIYVFLVVFFLHPQIKTFLLLNTNVNLMERRINNKEQMSLAYSFNISEATTLEKELKDKKELLPQREKHINSILFISNLIVECGIIEKEFIIGETAKSSSNSEIIKTPVKISGSGKYSDIMKLLTLIESAGEFYVMDDAVISSVSETEDDVEIALVITVYGDDKGLLNKTIGNK